MPVEKDLKLCDLYGECGRYQIVFLLWCCYISLTFSLTVLSVTFVAPSINTTCLINNDTANEDSISVSADQCHYEVKSESGTKTYQCQSWKYDHDFYAEGSTLTELFNLVCGREWLTSMANSMNQIGDLIASFCISYFSDRFGRRPVAVLSVLPGMVAYVIYLVNPSMELFLFAKLLSGFSGISTNYLAFVILVEMIGEKYRGAFGIISINLGWTFGYMALPGICWLLRNQFYFQIFSAIMCSPLLLSYWIVPESARWLILNSRMDEALQCVKRIKTVNHGKGFDEEKLKKDLQEIEGKIKDSTKESSVKPNFFDLFKTSEMRKRTSIMYFAWFTVALVYFGISMNAGILTGNVFLNFFYLAVIEIPSTGLAIFADKYMGRRPLLGLSICATGVMYIITLAVPQSFTSVQIALIILSKLFVSASFNFLYAFTSELFPTSIRSIGVCGGSGAARIGSIIAPFAAQLTQMTNIMVTFGIFGSISILSGALVFFLPETKKKPLPETIDDIISKVANKPEMEDRVKTSNVPVILDASSL